MSVQSPYSQVLDEGTYLITMPPSLMVGVDTYLFGSWSDADTNPVKTINLVGDLSLTATYVLQIRTHRLTIDSSPITVTFTIQRLS